MHYNKFFVLLMTFFMFILNVNMCFARNKENKIIYVFISFSMPEKLIKDYIEESKQNENIVFVLRGMIENNITKTVRKISQISDNKEVRVIIDPRLYKKFNITHVPTFVYANDVEYDLIDKDFDKISGNVTIQYAVERFKEDGKNE